VFELLEGQTLRAIHVADSTLLEGATLRARLAGGARPPLKALDYTIQMARGFAGR